LTGHVNYRKLRLARVAHYARLMERGGWLIAQPLIFDESEKLIDGQTRLNAVIKYGKAVQFIVLHNVPANSTACIDNGLTRSASDVLGNFLTSGAKDVQTILRAIRQGDAKNSAENMVYNCEVEELYDLFKDGIDFCLKCLTPKQPHRCIGPVFGAFGRAALTLEKSKLPELERCARVFMSEHYTEDRDVTMLSLNKCLRSYNLNRGGAVRSDIYIKTARAISAWMNHECLTRLYVVTTDDPFKLA